MRFPIKGLFQTYDDDIETIYFYNDKLLADNVVIQLEFWDLDDDDQPHYICVKHYNENDAGTWIFYWGKYLEPIQQYRIIKDIYDLYNEHTITEFAEILKNLSCQSMSASIQSTEEDRQQKMFDEIKADIDMVRKFVPLELIEGSEV